MDTEIRNLVLHIGTLLEDKKAQNLLMLDVSHLTIVADCFVIASGRSVVQVKALADELDEKLGAEGIFARRREGYAEGRWIVLDYGAVLVHLFHEEEREFYHLERLWMDGSNRIELN